MSFVLMLVVLGFLLILGTPIAISLILSGAVGYISILGLDAGLNSLVFATFHDMNNYVIAAIPLYIFMGQIMLKGGSGRDLFDFAQRFTSRIPGSLAVAATTASAIFAAISGSSSATAATIGSISIPEMIQRGYDKRMAAGVVAVSGTLGILIPPSISFILYSLVTNASVGKLFMAGIIPGIMLAVMFSVYSSLVMWRKDRLNKTERDTQADNIIVSGSMIGGLLIIPLVLGGIYAGWFTPTEAAGIGVVYALILTVFVKRSLGWRKFLDALYDSVNTSCMILMLIVGASVFGGALSLIRVPQILTEWIGGLGLTPLEFLISINLLYLVLGMFMDAAAAVLVTVPILLPGLESFGIDLIWFGVILVINLEIGAVTPPVGMNLFVVKAIYDEYTILDVLIGSIPYALIGLLGLALVIIFPEIALFLPDHLS